MRIVKRRSRNEKSFVYEIKFSDDGMYIINVQSVSRKRGLEVFELDANKRYVILNVNDSVCNVEFLGDFPEMLKNGIVTFMKSVKYKSLLEAEKTFVNFLILYALERNISNVFVIGKKVKITL